MPTRSIDRALRSQALSYVLFAATAFGVVLPGTVLPQLLTRWSLSDSEAGLLLFLAFVTSSGSALLARGRLARMAALGSAAAGAGTLGMAFASRAFGFVAVSVLGAGLGLAMTSVSLLQSRRHAANRAAELSRLNLLWSLGACLAPALLLRGAALWTLTRVLSATGIVFVVLGGAALLLVDDVPPASAAEVAAARPSSAHAARAMLFLLLMIPLATGVETSLGGWLTTYSRRSGLAAEGTAITVTALWLGLLLGRLAHSIRWVARRWPQQTLRYAPWLLIAASMALLLAGSGATMALSALAAGFALGPLYPLALALWLEQGEGGNLAFVIAGCGASAMPLLTGVVSEATHSLRQGLLVPLAGAALLAVLSMAAVRPRRTSAASA